MSRDQFEIGVVVAHRTLKGPWAERAWIPVAVLPGTPVTAPWTRLGTEGGDELYYAGAAVVFLHACDTSHYRDNLTSGRPSVWVVLRPVEDRVEVALATVDPYEGEALAETVGDVVEAMPMPGEVRERVQAFFDAFHVEREFLKRQRDRADPEAFGFRAPALQRKEGRE